MSRMLFSRIIVLLTVFIFNQSLFAATVAQEQDKLVALQQNLADQRENLTTLESELNALPDKIAATRKEFEQLDGERAAAQQALEQIQQEHAAEPSLNTERQLKLQEINTGLAERRARSEGRNLEQLQNQQQELQRNLRRTRESIDNIESQIDRQEQRVAQAIEQARQAERQAAAPPKPRAPIAPPPIEKPRVEAPAATAARQPEPAAPEVPVLSKREFANFEFAKDQMAALDERLAGAAASGSGSLSNVQLTGSRVEDTPFEYLGNEQYRAEAALGSGRQVFRIEDLRFRANIPDADSEQTYVFLLDARDRNQLKVSYFQKSLLDYIGKNPVVRSETDEKEEEAAVANTTVTEASQNDSGLSKADAFALEVAREEMARIEALLNEAGAADEPFFSRLTLSSRATSVVEFEYIGNNQYRVETSVPAGNHRLRVNSQRFRLEVPRADDGEVYVFLVDASRPSRLQLTAFKKSLLAHL